MGWYKAKAKAKAESAHVSRIKGRDKEFADKQSAWAKMPHQRRLKEESNRPNKPRPKKKPGDAGFPDATSQKAPPRSQHEGGYQNRQQQFTYASLGDLLRCKTP